jgi:hemerythrin superfamily protein
MEYYTIKDFCFEQDRYKNLFKTGNYKAENIENFKELSTPKLSKFQCLPQILLVKLTKEYLNSVRFTAYEYINNISEDDIFLFVGAVAQSPKQCVIQKIGDGHTFILDTDDVEVLYFHEELKHENIS